MLNDYLRDIHNAVKEGKTNEATKLSKRLTRATGMDALTQLKLIGELFNGNQAANTDDVASTADNSNRVQVRKMGTEHPADGTGAGAFDGSTADASGS